MKGRFLIESNKSFAELFLIKKRKFWIRNREKMAKIAHADFEIFFEGKPLMGLFEKKAQKI